MRAERAGSGPDMTWARENFIALDQVQLTMPRGEEAMARAFYGGVLGMTELVKPPVLAAKGGAWFAGGDGAIVQIHLGVEDGFHPARKAHPAVLVGDIEGLSERLEEAGYPVRWDDGIPGTRRLFCDDPFGNRLEFIEAMAG